MSFLKGRHLPRDRAMVPEEQTVTDGRRQLAASYTGPDTDPRVSASERQAVPVLRHEAVQ